MIPRAGGELDHEEVLSFKAASNAGQPGNLRTSGDHLLQSFHHLREGVVGELDEGWGFAEGLLGKFYFTFKKARLIYMM